VQGALPVVDLKLHRRGTLVKIREPEQCGPHRPFGHLVQPLVPFWKLPSAHTHCASEVAPGGDVASCGHEPEQAADVRPVVAPYRPASHSEPDQTQAGTTNSHLPLTHKSWSR
jgi:hypothetical protein